jgi:hypothetical protein
MEIIWHGRQKNGQLIISNIDRFIDYLKTFGDKRFDIIVKKPKKKRSNPQNSYYWGVVLNLISQKTGHTQDELHDAFARKYLRRYNRHGLEFIQSTTDLTTVEFSEYVEQIKRFAAIELDIVIPDAKDIEP